jgi:hypothetical protein
MDQSKIAAANAIANDVSNDTAENQNAGTHGANEIRNLNDLELMIAGGGDGIVCW